VERGTSASYLAARLKRDHPEIAEALARGENILSAPDIGHRVSVQRCAP
jgi:hypothetical protein